MANLFCLVCSKSFPEAELSGHVTSVHFGFLPFACTSCEFTAAQEAEVLQHADKQGHIPFVVDRSNAKPYLTSLSKQIVGHCKIFAVSKNFAGILAGLNAQIAADLSTLDVTKCAIRSGPVCGSETPLERMVIAAQSTLDSSLKSDAYAAPCSVTNGVCGLPEGLSPSVHTPSSNQSSGRLTARSESTAMSLENSIGDVFSVTDENAPNFAVTLCALCASSEAYSADQREGHVLEHLTQKGTASASSSDNPAAYFSELAQMWRLCFPPAELNADSNSASPERHVTTRTHGVKKKYATCLECGKCFANCGRTGHVWHYHMSGVDRSLFHRQFELCFGHPPRPVGRPFGKSFSSSTSSPAVSKPNVETSCGENLSSEPPRYPSRRSLDVRKVDAPDSSLTSITPLRKAGGDSSKLSSFVTKFGVVRRYMRDPSTGQFGPVPEKFLKLWPTRDSSMMGNLPVSQVPDPVTDGSVRFPPKIPRGRPKNHFQPMACQLCDNQKPVGSKCRASHVWYNHMHGYKRLTCDVCGSKDNFQTKMQADCAARHPDSKPIIRVLQSAEMRRKYEQQYLQCFGKLPSTAKGFFKSAKPNRPRTEGEAEKSFFSSNRKSSFSSNRKSSLSSNQKNSLSSNHKSSLSSNQKSSLSSNQKSFLSNQKSSRPSNRKMVPYPRDTSRVAESHPSNGGATQCQLCSFTVNRGPERSENIKRHALTRHFGSEPIYACSKCGYGCNFTNRSNVVRHVRLVHKDDPSVHAIDRSRKLARNIQQCLDSCFPGFGRKWYRRREKESVHLLSEATIGPNLLAFDQPSTSDFAAVEGDNRDAETGEEEELAIDYDDSDEEVSLAIVKQKQRREKGRCKRAAAPVKTEEFDD